MARAAVYTALAACVVWLSGCGTVLNLWSLADGDPHNDGGAYGGVAMSTKEGAWHVKEAIRPDNDQRAWNAFIALWFLGIDTPLSAALDTLTLPVTILGTLEKAESGKSTPPGTFTPDPDPVQQPARSATPPPSPASTATEQQPGQ